MRITFHGAAQQVTGSAHLVEVGPHRILLDCGLFDSDRLDPESPNRQFAFDPRSLDAVIVSHGHNDHIGRLPCLIRGGYRGPLYATRATADITNIMLRDSARIQREDARDNNVRNPDEPPLEPLFDLADVEFVIDNLVRRPYLEPLEILDGVTLTYLDAGHILGSAIVQLDLRENGRTRRLVFTGDIGRRDSGFLPDPTPVQDVDVLITESTYGGRRLDPYPRLLKQLAAIVARATRLRSKIVIPAFSLGRTQRMVYCLQELFTLHRVRPIPVYVDSPLALRLTEIHREHRGAYVPTARRLMDRDPEYFGSRFVEFCLTWSDSRRLNDMSGPMIIVASSGMCDAGRIRHHLRHAVEDPDNAVVIVSFQAEGTLGRKIAEGAERIQILDQWHDLNCAVYVLDGFSGHADHDDLAWWFEQTAGNIGAAFLVHGEPKSLDALAPTLQPFVNTPVHIPAIGDAVEV